MYLTRKLLGERVVASFRAGKTLSLIYAERSQIDQVLWNLLVNARDAMPDGGELLVETASSRSTQSFTATREWARPGDFVRLSVSDTGIGMDQETLKKIFDSLLFDKGGRPRHWVGTRDGLRYCQAAQRLHRRAKRIR